MAKELLNVRRRAKDGPGKKGSKEKHATTEKEEFRGKGFFFGRKGGRVLKKSE